MIRMMMLAAFMSGMLVLAGHVQADLITFGFSGTVTYITFSNGTPTEFVVGNAVTGTYTFDSSNTDSYSDPTQGYYLGSIDSASITIGSYLAAGSTTGHVLINDSSFDRYNVGEMSLSGSTVLGQELDNLILELIDDSATALTNDDLLLLPPHIADFSSRQELTAHFSSEDRSNVGQVRANLESIFFVSSVPEPTSFAMFGIAMIGMARRNRRPHRGI